MEKIKLSSSQIKYLLTINKLSLEHEKIRSSDIADDLKLAKPSVHKMMNTLKDMDFINKEHYGDISLTERGKQISEQYAEIFSLIYNHLSIKVSNKEEIENAVLAFLSEFTTFSLKEIMDFYKENRHRYGSELKITH